MGRNLWIWALVGLMLVALALGALVNFTSAYLALPVLFVVLIAGLILRVAGSGASSYDPPEEAKATGHRLPRSPESEA